MINCAECSITEMKKFLGSEVGLSDWVVINQERINKFARLTEDEQFIHIDPERASKETPFGGTVAHGFLTLSMLVKLAESALPKIKDVKFTINYGFDKIRFIYPVAANSNLRARFILKEVEERSLTQIMTKWDVSVEIKNVERPAIVATWVNLLMF
ncbi:MAG: MaoC family dehydratase [Paracoccaceae bacterium]